MSEKHEVKENVEEKMSFLTKLKVISEQRWFVQTLPIVILVLLVLLFTALTGGRFANPKILQIIFQQALIVATVATGASFIYASGNINLAMGATTVLTGVICSQD